MWICTELVHQEITLFQSVLQKMNFSQQMSFVQTAENGPTNAYKLRTNYKHKNHTFVDGWIFGQGNGRIIILYFAHRLQPKLKWKYEGEEMNTVNNIVSERVMSFLSRTI